MVECELVPDRSYSEASPCFNRYMVECEFVACGALAWYVKVLIDTWWNVNFALHETEKKCTSFNRYMVECE